MTESEINTFQSERIKELHVRMKRLLDEHIVKSLQRDVSGAISTFSVNCIHGDEFVLWREVHRPIYKSMAELIRLPSKIPYGTTPEEWFRCVSIAIDIEDIHPIVATDERPLCSPSDCPFCGKSLHGSNYKPCTDYFGRLRGF